MKYTSGQASIVEVLSIYGYSCVVFVPALTLCIYPSHVR